MTGFRKCIVRNTTSESIMHVSANDYHDKKRIRDELFMSSMKLLSTVPCMLSIEYRSVISRGLSTILQILHCSSYRCNLCTISGHHVLRYRLPQILHSYTSDRYIRMNIQLACTTVLFLIIFSKSFSYLWSSLSFGSES